MTACAAHQISLAFSVVAVVGAAGSAVAVTKVRYYSRKAAKSRYEVVRDASAWLAREVHRDPTAFSDDTRATIAILESTLDRSLD